MTDSVTVEGIYAEPIESYIFIERRGDLILRVGFSEERPGDQSMLALRILQYLLGSATSCDVYIDSDRQSAFQREVTGIVAEIPRGETLTYGDVANRLDRPKAARAVGRALAANPFPIIIPCHRVVAARGIGGYSWGVEMKAKILALERENERGTGEKRPVSALATQRLGA